MVCKPSIYLVSAAVALVAQQMHQATATSLEFDPFTTCNSFDIGDENFPGRGGEIDEDANCNVTVPQDPNLPRVPSISTVPVADKSLLSKTGGEAGHVREGPCEKADEDAYVATEQATLSSVSTTSTTGRRLEWVSGDDIAKLEAYFGTAMERKLKNLPTTAVHGPSPWAGSSWPVYRDGINFEWSEGQPSAAEKYAKAFGLDAATFMDRVSAQNGINSQPRLPRCTSNEECHDPKTNVVCAKRGNETSGYCIPTWHGISHAWAPAAILEQEPNCPVTFNGVTFQPKDIKGLLTDVYYGAKVSTVFAGSRYNGYNDLVDAHGSHTDYSYRDLNPGFFHVAAANLLGLLNTTFIVDRDAGYEVSNQPVVGFKVYEQTAMSPQKAANAFYGLETYPWNENATSIVYVKSRLSWINETDADGGLIASGMNEKLTAGAYYDYLLELNDVEEIIGGEWLYGSNDNHPDFLWFLQGKPAADTVTKIGLSYADVAMLLEKSVAC